MVAITIDKKLCKGCGICVEFCPSKVFEESRELDERGFRLPIPAYAEKCKNCGLCGLLCPDFAIAIMGEK